MILEKSSAPPGLRKRPWQPPPVQHDLTADVEALDPALGYPGYGNGGLPTGFVSGTDAMAKATPDAPEVVPFRRVSMPGDE